MNRTGRIFATVALPLLALLAAGAPATPTVGVEGKVEVDLPGTALSARPVTEKAPLLLRIASSRPVAQGATHYDLRYVGLESGNFDLKDYLLRADGTSNADLPPIPVTVASLLPPEHQGQLVPARATRWPFFGGYRWALAGLALVWLALLVPLIRMGRKHRREPAVDAPPPPPPTFADRIRPLIDQAARGELSTAEQGRLERMLLWYWRQRLELTEQSPADAIAALRRHPEAGALLRALEQWLHRPSAAPVSAGDVAALLEPYRHALDPTEPQLATNVGGGS